MLEDIFRPDPTRPDPSEVGCQINLLTGEHYGECLGSCQAWPVKATPEEVVDYILSLFDTRMWDEEFADHIYTYLEDNGYITGHRWYLVRS